MSDSQKIIAKLKYLRVAPRKTRLVADTIRGLSVSEAEANLMFLNKRASQAILKLLHSATANAKHNHQLDASRLYVKEIRVDGGPKTKRWNPRARGSVNLIEKKMSHVTITLGASDKLKPARFVVLQKTKKDKVAAKPKKEKISEESKEQKPVSKIKKTGQPGFFKKVFRRKSI
ncbi:MAG: 50S ribosomal protein L22 [Patescibacteria group bacterium]